MKSACAFISYCEKSGCSKRKNLLKLWQILGNGQYANFMPKVETSHCKSPAGHVQLWLEISNFYDSGRSQIFNFYDPSRIKSKF